VELVSDRTHPDLSNELRAWALAFAKRSHQEPSALSQLNCQGPQVVILQVEDAQKMLEAANSKKGRVEQIGNYRVYLANGDPSRAIMVLDHETVALGDVVAVKSVASVTSGKEDSLYQGRADVRSLLAAYSKMPTATFTLQTNAAGAVSDSAKNAGIVLSSNPLFSLLGLRGMATGSQQSEQVCMASFGVEYNNRLASILVASVFRVFAVLNAIPGELPEELGPPESIDVEQERGLAMATAYFDAKKCEAINHRKKRR
jgi:hypothetical protein